MVSFPGNNHKHTGRVHAKGQDDESQYGTAVRYGTLRRRTAGWQACNSNRELSPLWRAQERQQSDGRGGEPEVASIPISPLCLPPPMAWYVPTACASDYGTADLPSGI